MGQQHGMRHTEEKRDNRGIVAKQWWDRSAPWWSAVALWAAQAPLQWSWLGWLAPIGWLHWAVRPGELKAGDWWRLWLSGCLFWLATLQGIRLAFWPLYAGWVALSLYLAVYIPLFVLTTRWLLRRHLPLWLAASVAWMGGEWIRSWMLSGYAANMLAHTQAANPAMIQACDQIGGFGLSALMVVVSSLLYQTLAMLYHGTGLSGQGAADDGPGCGGRLTARVAGILLVVVGLYAYGQYRLWEAERLYGGRPPLLRAALVQENTPTMFEADMERLQKAWTAYLEQTRAAAKHQPVDVVVWPESTFSSGTPWVASQASLTVPTELRREGIDAEFLQQWQSRALQQFQFKSRLVLEAARGEMPRSPDAEPKAMGEEDAVNQDGDLAPPHWPHLIVGSDAVVFDGDRLRRYNAALHIDPRGNVVGYYNKMHLVMFGEYIPLQWCLGWLGRLFGFSGIEAGDTPVCFDIAGVHLSPNICFESMMPRLVRWQVKSLRRNGHEVDCLVNLTNDSWFRGSSMLDHHLASSILVAVENRRPMLIAANTGISAEVDGCGRVKHSLDRFQAGVLVAEPRRDGRRGLVQTVGYPFAVVCGLVVLVAGLQLLGASLQRLWCSRSAGKQL
ncbi:MAG: apolipoprotein N-acyltransferase [Pirellulaceae bacterium]|nr:MAG: apolipoprotein N-acyltransferase [Pirellulaceae bacterium]